MSRPSFAPEPAATVAVREEDLAVRFAVAASARSAALGEGGRRGTPESVAFGVIAGDLRARLGMSRSHMAVRSGLDPIYLTMLETGLLGPDEITAAAVAMLAVGLGRSLADLPLTPYEPGREPTGDAEVEDGRVRLHPGLETLAAWVDARLAPAGSPPVPVSIPLPPCSVPTRRGTRLLSGELSSTPVPGAALDDYSWQIVRGRAAGHPAGWWVHLRAADAAGQPAPGTEIRLEIGPHRDAGETDSRGLVTFERVDPAAIEPLRLVVR